MKTIAIAAAALMLAGCAHQKPVMQKPEQPQVNRAKKADKYVMPKKAVEQPMPVPNEVVRKRWFNGFKVKLFH